MHHGVNSQCYVSIEKQKLTSFVLCSPSSSDDDYDDKDNDGDDH